MFNIFFIGKKKNLSSLFYSFLNSLFYVNINFGKLIEINFVLYIFWQVLDKWGWRMGYGGVGVNGCFFFEF